MATYAPTSGAGDTAGETKILQQQQQKPHSNPSTWEGWRQNFACTGRYVVCLDQTGKSVAAVAVAVAKP